ncbi:LrgB family protein [Bacillus piscicola]|uniref:LrgB family protein n=1 Tax=Bacillus piscicola TaxID=1632684 RepID=UPI001F09147D|nr:LrgB family protein [Bacillus piscicola]
MNEWLAGILAIAGTIIVYVVALKVYQRFHYPFTLPVLTGMITIISFLILTGISYDTYMIGGRWIEHLLGPAVVGLAFPLYNQRKMLKKYFSSIITGVLAGAFAGVLSGYYFSLWAHLEEMVIASILPKSVTTPIAMDIAFMIDGLPPLTAVLVMVAGIGGAVLAPYIYKWFRIEHVLARGVGAGSASHGIGTAKAIENSEMEGAASSVAMTLSAVVVSMLIPLMTKLVF